MNILITGANGFAGSHLAEQIFKSKEEFPGSRDLAVFGLVRRNFRKDNLEDAGLMTNLHPFFPIVGDLQDAFAIDKIISEIKPMYIFHLGAQSFVKLSWDQPIETLRTNVEGTINILEAVRRHCPEAFVQIACTSEEYGLVLENEVPITENNPLRPQSPYAVSKVSADFIAYQYHMSYGLNIVRTRTFNHSGPRRGEEFVVSAFCKQAAMINADMLPRKMLVGNLEAKRDFTDVRDIVKAYILSLTKKLRTGPWNIASGVEATYSMQTVLDMVLETSNLKGIEIKEDLKRMRPSDVPVLVGDATKFRAATGWRPSISFEKTVEDTYKYWVKRINRQ